MIESNVGRFTGAPEEAVRSANGMKQEECNGKSNRAEPAAASVDKSGDVEATATTRDVLKASVIVKSLAWGSKTQIARGLKAAWYAVARTIPEAEVSNLVNPGCHFSVPPSERTT